MVLCVPMLLIDNVCVVSLGERLPPPPKVPCIIKFSYCNMQIYANFTL